jgi:hypothetical protein
MKVSKFLPDILFKKTFVHTTASCGQSTEFINVKTSSVYRSLSALQVQSNFLTSAERERYLPRLQDPPLNHMFPFLLVYCILIYVLPTSFHLL